MYNIKMNDLYIIKKYILVVPSYYVKDGGLIGILTSWLRRYDLNFDKKKKREIGFKGR